MTYLRQRIPQIRRLLQEHLIEARPFVADRRFVLEVCEEVTFCKVRESLKESGRVRERTRMLGLCVCVRCV